MATAAPHLDELEKASQEALLENTAQSIFENLTKLREFSSVHTQRWIWELLQNAADAADTTNSVEVVYSGNKLKFRHQGLDFTAKEISHLIYHGSTKQSDPKKKGKFGSGFLSVHLVAERVKIRGTLKDSRGKKAFEFNLDRGGQSSEEILERMRSGMTEFRSSLREISAEEVPQTEYEFAVEPGTKSIVESGVRNLQAIAPFVLAFVPELSQISLSVDGDSFTWCTDQRTMTAQSCMILRQHHDDTTTLKIDWVGHRGGNLLLAVVLKRREELWEIETLESIPKLYCPFPLVDTHDLGTPFVIMSDSFHPLPERTGIYAMRNEADLGKLTEPNWTLLENVPGLYPDLLNKAASQKWLNIHLLAIWAKSKPKDWLDNDRFDSRIAKKSLELFRSHENSLTFENSSRELAPLDSILIPIGQSAAKVLGLSRQFTDLRKRIPSDETVQEWKHIIEAWAPILSVNVDDIHEAIGAKRLYETSLSRGSLNDLQMGLDEGVVASTWMNEVLEVLSVEGKQPTSLPNQDGDFVELRQLYIDPGIDNKLKDLCSEYGLPSRDILLHLDVLEKTKKALQGKGQSQEDFLRKLLEKAKENMQGDEIQRAISSNAKLLKWLIANKRTEKIVGYPVACQKNSREFSKERSLLKPTRLWDAESTAFSDLFPASHTMHDVYADILEQSDWDFLLREGLIVGDLIHEENVDSFEQKLVAEELDESEHSPKNETAVTRLVYLDGDEGLIKALRDNKTKTRLLLKFLSHYLLKKDSSWRDLREAECTCGKKHKLFPAWLASLRSREWVPVTKGNQDKPTAQNLGVLLDNDLRDVIVGDKDMTLFLDHLGIGLPDLLRNSVKDQSQRLQLDQISAKIYGVSDSAALKGIEAILDDSELRKRLIAQIDERDLIRRNQQIGKLVEKLLKASLDNEGLMVERTYRGSDYSVENDYIENGQQVVLVCGKTLLEVKSTRTNYAKMTLTQADEAVGVTQPELYVLAVVPLGTQEPTEELVRNNSRFVVGIGNLLRTEHQRAKELKQLEVDVSQANAGADVQLLVEGSEIRVAVNEKIWTQHGIPFGDFVTEIKKRKVI